MLFFPLRRLSAYLLQHYNPKSPHDTPYRGSLCNLLQSNLKATEQVVIAYHLLTFVIASSPLVQAPIYNT